MGNASNRGRALRVRERHVYTSIALSKRTSPGSLAVMAGSLRRYKNLRLSYDSVTESGFSDLAAIRRRASSGTSWDVSV
jgi:hypothetical protein